jgi:hypothetical protein
MRKEFGGRTQEIFDAVPEHLLGGTAKAVDAKLPAAGITRNRAQMEGVATTLSECAERERHSAPQIFGTCLLFYYPTPRRRRNARKCVYKTAAGKKTKKQSNLTKVWGDW